MLRLNLYNLERIKLYKPFVSNVNILRHVGTSEKQSGTSTEEHPIIERKREDIIGTTTKKPQKPPFVKNLFLGKFDREVLTYPEVLNKDRHEMLHEMLVPIEKFFKEEVDSKKIDREAQIPLETLKGLKELGLYGLQIPEEYGGLSLNATEYARIAEIISLDGSIAVTLSAHQAIGLKGILLNGTEAQKQKYLPRLATGEWTAAFCLTEESSGSDAASIQTKATLTENGKGYVLNGTKLWISNGGTADVMTVFARTMHPNNIHSSITAFIVERNFGGVTSGKPEDKLGIRGSNTTTVHFDNTYVPKENLLGEEGDGFKIGMNILNSGRFSMGSACAGSLKELMASTVEHAVNRKQFGQPLSEFALIKEKIARMAVNIYAMESMAYLTAGLIDAYEDQDCSLEAAIVKVFSSEKVWEHTSDCIQILGGLGYMKDCSHERFLRDSRIAQIFEGTNEILRLFIALGGLQHAGKELKALVKKLRNPFMHPEFIFKTVFKRMKRRSSNPKLDLNLYEYVHPSFKDAVDHLETATKLFEFATETLLAREGNDVILPKNQYNLKRLADVVIDIYAMTAVIGRASRSYCIGVHKCEHELLITNVFSYEALERIKMNLNEVNTTFNEVDNIKTSIANDIFESKGYVAHHPLTRTFW